MDTGERNEIKGKTDAKEANVVREAKKLKVEGKVPSRLKANKNERGDKQKK